MTAPTGQATGPHEPVRTDATVSGVPIVLDEVTKIYPGQDTQAVDHVSLDL